MASPSFCSSSTASLSDFPFLTSQEFECACRAFLHRAHVLGNSALGWSSIRLLHQVAGPVLKISRNIANVDPCHYDDTFDTQEPPDDTAEDDPEALIRTSDSNIGLQVEYEILLSPTYQVPVLHFTLRRGSQPGPLGIDSVYRYMVANQYRKELQSVGVMGGISFGYHPQSGTPTFFVHPCNTADAMKNIAGHQQVTPETYLIIWLGLVGNHLGLNLPCGLFATRDMQLPQSIEQSS